MNFKKLSNQSRIKRSKFIFVRIGTEKSLNIIELLKGNAVIQDIDSLTIYSIIGEESKNITKEELNVLLEISSVEWIKLSKVGKKNRQLIFDFLQDGFILLENYENNILLERENILINTNWNELSAFYHFMTKWKDVNLDAYYDINSDNIDEFKESSETLNEYILKQGFPPEHFATVGNESINLPLKTDNQYFYKLLLKRKTTRMFQKNSPLNLNDFSKILYYVFGCHGTFKVYQDNERSILGVKKTSPSGGGLHPTEVYPLVINVEGIESGIYHYNIEKHSLEIIKNLSIEEASKLANEFTAGQSYPKNANALFILTSRFFRNFWKYNKHPHAYKVLLMDAAHLSQTFYLVCADLNLGAFTTAAINTGNIEKELNLNGFTEAPVLIVGCGIPDAIDLAPDYEEYSIKEIKKRRSTANRKKQTYEGHS